MDKTAGRRRGEALEGALLAAAWDELTGVGYGRFTIEGVAARAKTSRPVLYRRWPNRRDLALAAITARFDLPAEPPPDTGSLRGDLVALLTSMSDSRAEVFAVVGMRLSEFLADADMTLSSLRAHIMAGRASRLDAVLDRAVARGEVDAAKLTSRVRALPGDLMRHELLMTLRPVPPETIGEIVDEIFLPLVRTERR